MMLDGYILHRGKSTAVVNFSKQQLLRLPPPQVLSNQTTHTWDNYLRFVERTWDPGLGTSDLSSVASSLAALRSSLSSWDKEVFGSVKEKIKSIREKLEEERSDNLYRGPTVREKNLMAELSEVLMREEMMERQHSRVEWLREGDRNTGYFQAKAKARARTNRIRTLRSEDGTVYTTQKDLQRLASNFYQQLFTGPS